MDSNVLCRVELKEEQHVLCEAAIELELTKQSQKSREDASQLTIQELNLKVDLLEVNSSRNDTITGDYEAESNVQCDETESCAQQSNVQSTEMINEMTEQKCNEAHSKILKLRREIEKLENMKERLQIQILELRRKIQENEIAIEMLTVGLNASDSLHSLIVYIVAKMTKKTIF